MQPPRGGSRQRAPDRKGGWGGWGVWESEAETDECVRKAEPETQRLFVCVIVCDDETTGLASVTQEPTIPKPRMSGFGHFFRRCAWLHFFFFFFFTEAVDLIFDNKFPEESLTDT